MTLHINSIRNNVRSLDPAHLKILSEILNEKEKKFIKEVISKTFEKLPYSPDIVASVKLKINSAKKKRINLTRRKDRKTFFHNFNKKKNKTKFLQGTSIFPNSSDLAKKLSQKKLIKLINETKKRNPNKPVKLKIVLMRNGYSPEISNIFLNDRNLFERVELTGLTFNNCFFDWCHLSNTRLNNVKFMACPMYNVAFTNSELKNCVFDHCELQECMFTAAQLDGMAFKSCSLISSSFEDATIKNSKFASVSMPATHFLNSNVKENNTIVGSDLTDTVFFGNFENFSHDDPTKLSAKVTGPTCAILINPHARGISTPKAYMKLDQSAHTIPLRITSPALGVQKEVINQEVEKALKKIKEAKGQTPIAQKLVELVKEKPGEYPQCFKIIGTAEKMATEVDSFFLPGGEDIPPALYGEKEQEKTAWGGDYRRSILELGIIHQSFQKGIPLMAVCRGFQMSNVYFGAKLVQHVTGHLKKTQKYNLLNKDQQGLYFAALKDSVISLAAHHQAISAAAGPAEHLVPAVIYKGLIKASELGHSASTPMILLQFHPEFYKAVSATTLLEEAAYLGLNYMMTPNNEVFWRLLSDSAQSHRIKKLALSKVRAF